MHGVRPTPLLDTAAATAAGSLWNRSGSDSGSNNSNSNSSNTPESPDELQKLYDSVLYDDSYRSNGSLAGGGGQMLQQQRSAFGARPIGEFVIDLRVLCSPPNPHPPIGLAWPIMCNLTREVLWWELFVVKSS